MKNEHDGLTMPAIRTGMSSRWTAISASPIRAPRDAVQPDDARGYSYSGVTNSGQLDMGLLFVCYQHDLEKGFLTVQKRLNGEALEEYIKPIGGGYFFALPGATIVWKRRI
ncbi:hypothetical protein ACNKHO_06590 [Shigella flexneri]